MHILCYNKDNGRELQILTRPGEVKPMPLHFKIDILEALKKKGVHHIHVAEGKHSKSINHSKAPRREGAGMGQYRAALYPLGLSARRFTGIRQGSPRRQVIYGNYKRPLMRITIVRKSSAARKNRKRVVTFATKRQLQAILGRCRHVRRYGITPCPYHGRNTRLGEEAWRKR